MNIMKRIIIATVTFTTLSVTAVAFADRDEGKRQGKMVERISSKLELDDAQKQALENFSAELQETRQLMRGDGEGLRSEFSDLISAPAFDQGQALSLINDRAAAVQANAPELVAAAAVFFDGLSEEQKAQVQDFMEKGGRHRRGKNRDH
ncbi:Spy/CpxP family protein refolding chaperone [Granulosicoccus sp. 3-233]|uniref:Spy/CpxP family protein refolding chaperone n=1 Tax=Granulosicoccus sp. 3-233 TaxID=3417969 RepID=UPI003D32620D